MDQLFVMPMPKALESMKKDYNPIMVIDDNAELQKEHNNGHVYVLSTYNKEVGKHLSFKTIRGIGAGAGKDTLNESDDPKSKVKDKDYTAMIESVGRFMIENKKIIAQTIKAAKYLEKIAAKVKSKK